MGLVPNALGPADQAVVRKLEPEIVATLRLASDKVRGGRANEALRRWFGDDSQVWRYEVARKLGKMASVVNTTPIEVSFTHKDKRSTGTVAAAKRPKESWGDYTNMTKAQGPDFTGQNFRVRLDIGWNRRPTHTAGVQPGQSKFKTLVHELTHLILNTDDVTPAYGVQNCRNKATHHPADAKRNADNWAFFVQELR
jgi:hypothetical protein